MNEIFAQLGIESFYDFNSIVNEDSFEKLSTSLVKRALKMYKLNYQHLSHDAESKFQHVNRILMLKYGMMIAPSRSNPHGYQLEMVMGGTL